MYSVLIVDDYDFSRHELSSMNIWGDPSGFYITAEARNGKEALQILRRQSVDLVITDIRMPFIDGIALTEMILNEKLCPCIILVSQFSYFEYARRGIQHGAFEYLVKPLNSGSVLGALQRASVYIRERYLELMKINYADQVISAQSVDCYPYEELDMLASSISEGGGDAAVIASEIIDHIWMMTDHDPLKTAYYLGRILSDLDTAVRRDFPWLSKLTKLASRTVDFTAAGDIDAMRSALLDYISKIIATLSKYQLADPESGIIKTACSLILENVDEPISLNALAKKLFISNSYLSLLFKQKTGINMNTYIKRAKMERSRILLEEGQLKSYEIAEKIGFSVEYFSKLFKKTYTISPMEYRKNL